MARAAPLERIQDVGTVFPAYDLVTPRFRKSILRDLNAGMSEGANRITPEAADVRGLPLTQRSQRYASSTNFTETAF